MQSALFEVGWLAVRDGNDAARAFYHRHYSRRRYSDGRRPLKILGPGEYIMLLHSTGRALFAWRKFIDDCPGQHGVNCAIFRNEGAGLSSRLIIEAEERAEDRWPGERRYTYIDPIMIASGLPGYCFLRAGWRYCGWTSTGKRIMERPGITQAPDYIRGIRKRERFKDGEGSLFG